MRDIPMFTTENGVASLSLQEVPYRQEAYVRLRSWTDLGGLISDCAAFCRAVGARQVYATGDGGLEDYPLHTAILQMRCPREALADTDAAVFPVTEQTLSRWQGLYNDAMAGVACAAWLTDGGVREMLTKGDGYFVHRQGTLLGIGRASGGRLDAVVSALPGAGRDVVLALCHCLCEDTVTLEVASTNLRAIRLYEKLGFGATGERIRWYRIP